MEQQEVSTIKKAVVAIFALVFFMLFAVQVAAQTTIGGSGELFTSDKDEVTINLDFDHRQEVGDGWQYVFESDYYYASENGDVEFHDLYTQFKLNKDLSDKSYFLAVLQVDYDEIRDYDVRSVLGAGYGRKLYKSDKWKVSNELSLAYLEGDTTELIVRNSLWVAYMLSERVSITNKALYETSKETYIRIETELAYQVSEKFSVNISNQHTDSYKKETILTFGFELAL
jgi:hypothetical protein|tara:strand:+ start:292 stop:975 length:684 start_codon:yes stop_codon:yes gene_type:complete